jgi:hypothetical protein
MVIKLMFEIDPDHGEDELVVHIEPVIINYSSNNNRSIRYLLTGGSPAVIKIVADRQDDRERGNVI